METNVISKELEEKIAAAKTLEDVVKACAEEGIEVTKEQLEAELAKTEGGELSEDALDNVSGGVVPIVAAAGVAAGAVLIWLLRKKR